MKTHLILSLDRIAEAGNDVSKAIEEALEETDIFAARPGLVNGMTFVTSGPGSGWTREFTVTDFVEDAARVFRGEGGDSLDGFVAIDVHDGKAAVGDEDGDWSWTDETAVEVEVPTIDEAADHPEAFAATFSAVQDEYLRPASRHEWDSLIASIRQLSEVVE